MKRRGRGRVFGLVLALPFVLLLIDSADPLRAESGWRVEVVEAAARLRAAPDTGSAVVAMLPRGEVLEVRSWSPAVWAVAMSDVDRYLAPAFWIHAVDTLGHEGWIASPLVVPVNAWPDEPWMLGEIGPDCSGGSSTPVAGKVSLDIIETFERGGRRVHWPVASEDPAAREAFVAKVSKAKWIQVLRQNGGFSWVESKGPGVTCSECPEGLGSGPSIEAIRWAEGAKLAVVRERGPENYQELLRSGGRMPFLFSADKEHLFALLGEFQSLAGIDLGGVTELECSQPLPLWESSTQKTRGLWNCSFSAGGTPWALLFGIQWSDGKPSPWLVRFAAQTRFEPQNAEFLEERRATLGADVQTTLQEWLVSDLNGDRTLELWFRTQVRADEYQVPGWEVYFVRAGEALGPWFILTGGGWECL